jgi:rubrerythrin
MSVAFAQSRTRENLMRAFAGESQARNRYTMAAQTAKEQKQQVLAELFWFTADQEREHAEIFYRFLKECSGESIAVDGSYQVDFSENLSELLRMAQHNEQEEAEDVYQAFGRTAREEGFEKIAAAFFQIAGIEKTHGERFGRFAGYVENGSLHASNEVSAWICTNCGFIYEGTIAPMRCPVCDHDQGYFVKQEYASDFL